MKLVTLIILLLFLLTPCSAKVKLKSLAHLSGLQENPITGYGLVIGLAGSGDSKRNKETTQAIANLLHSFGVNLNPNEINSRNTATVIITANLPYYAHQGDKLDINVASLGDARSLLGGTLLATPLKGPDNQVYALAQGPISIGGFKYDSLGNILQKNHPTTGLIPGGAIIEKSLYNELNTKDGDLHLILNKPDFTTAEHIENALNTKFGGNIAFARSAQDIQISPPQKSRSHFVRFISQVENTEIRPDITPTVVVNERTGVIIAGTNVKIEAVTISHGNMQIAITDHYQVSQPWQLINPTREIKTVITPASNIVVKETTANIVNLPKDATIAQLIAALTKIQTSTRDIISILESLKSAGALHAELIIQ
jgi:flagellar P-ring protein precursor FlgI